MLPNAGEEDDAPKTGVDPRGEEDGGVPNTPVEVLPKKEPPDCEPKGFVLPKGLGANGLLLVCPKPDCDPNGLVDDCPKAFVDPNMVFDSQILRSSCWRSKFKLKAGA